MRCLKGECYSTCDAICAIARDAGLEVLGTINRPIHQTKRSFSKPARRARFEQLVVLRKPNRPTNLCLNPPTYRMRVYEQDLRAREIDNLIGVTIDESQAMKPVKLKLQQPALWQARRLTFTHDYAIGNRQNEFQPTWQKILENGDADPTKTQGSKIYYAWPTSI